MGGQHLLGLCPKPRWGLLAPRPLGRALPCTRRGLRRPGPRASVTLDPYRTTELEWSCYRSNILFEKQSHVRSIPDMAVLYRYNVLGLCAFFAENWLIRLFVFFISAFYLDLGEYHSYEYESAADKFLETKLLIENKPT